MTLLEACTQQAIDESDSGLVYDEYINTMSNYELLQFLDRVQINYGKDIE